jgi:Fic family protein
MRERPEKRPGEFKNKPNKAGNTYFVSSAEVIGTLTHGFEYYQLLTDGIEKALFMHFLVSEVHPFEDGNGRLSRIMMNAELVKSGLFKIIIPSAHRDNYLNGLRLASRDHEFRIYCKVIDQAAAYTASVNWLHYNEAREKIEADFANLTSDEGLPQFNRALRMLALSEFPA